MVTLPVPINLLSRRGGIGNECCDTRSLICLLPAALFWYWQPVAVAQSISGSLRRPALQYACTRHNWKRTPSVTNRSPPEEGECASMLCACLLSTSGSVHPGYSPTTRIRLIWISPTTNGVSIMSYDYEERHMPPFKRPEPPPKPDDSD